MASGVGVWMVWEGNIAHVANQIFTEFGGFHQGQEGNQSLWYFFGDEAFRALGRLIGYARMNRMPMFIEAFPASMLVGYKFEMSVTTSAEFLNQEAAASQDLEVLVHPQFHSQIEQMPGLDVKATGLVSGLAKAEFETLSADMTFAQDSPLGWFFVLRPLGDPLEKNTAEGWRAIYSEMQGLLEHLAIKYISNDGYLIFGLNTFRAFRSACRELLLLEAQIKAPDSGKKYWPSVMACVLKKGYNLNKDLPRRLNLDWKQLAPDYPHMSFRSALYLGKGFRINDVRYSRTAQTIDDWCHVSLAPDEETDEALGELPFKLPTSLLVGDLPPCFYCGLNNHAPKDCPSKALPDMDLSVWEQLGMVDLAKLNEAGISLGGALAADPITVLAEGLKGQDAKGILLRGLFEMSYYFQLRALERVWRGKGKELPGGIEDSNLAPADGDYLWSAVSALRNNDWEGVEREVNLGITKFGRGLQPRSVQGFQAMEQGDWTRAAYFWQEAARGAYSPLHRGYLLFLEGRAMEAQGEFQKALTLYRQAKAECPRWLEPAYRQGVCMVKMGFTDQGLYEFLEQMRDNPHVFNRLLLDPELERGRISIMAALWKPWTEALAARDEKAASLPGLPEYLKSWFREEHPFLKTSLERAAHLGEMAKINNYVCYKQVVGEFDSLQNDLRQTVDKSIARLNARLKDIHEDLKDIHHEGAWFPFSKLLREFNADFNACATKLNWMRTTSLHVAANFRKSQDYVDEIDTAIKLLKARLVTLRIVRDATLFILLLGKSFMWLELVGLALSLVAVPSAIYFAQKSGQVWLADVLGEQKWQVQKGLVIIVSIVALAMSAIKTAVSFEKKRTQIFKEEEDKAKARHPRKGKKSPVSRPALPAGKTQPANAAASAKPSKGK